MKIDLEPIFNIDGSEKCFDYFLDLSDQVFNGSKPFQKPVKVKGKVSNRAGIVEFDADVDLILDTMCDRCAKPIDYSFNLDVEHTLVASLNDENNDDLLLVDEMMFDVDELITDDIFLNLPFKFLCKDDCKGLCPKCGSDLNSGNCKCKREIDPRLAALQQLLDD